MDKIIEALRASVRPVSTYGVIGSLLYMVVTLGFQYADEEMAKQATSVFFGIVGTVVGVWYGSRTSK